MYTCVIGEEAVKVYETFQYADGESDDKLAGVFKKFEEHCNPIENTIYERYSFQCRKQEAGETGLHYLTKLRDTVQKPAISQILQPVSYPWTILYMA